MQTQKIQGFSISTVAMIYLHGSILTTRNQRYCKVLKSDEKGVKNEIAVNYVYPVSVLFAQELDTAGLRFNKKFLIAPLICCLVDPYRYLMF